MKTGNLFLIGCLALAAVSATQGCTPEKKYDLENMDTEITVLKGVSVPLPNFKEIKFKDLIQIDQQSQQFTVTPNGDYMLNFSMDPTSVDGFTVPNNAFSINVNGGDTKHYSLGVTSIPANTPLQYSEEDKAALQDLVGSSVDLDLVLSDDFTTQDIELQINTDFSVSDFPKEVSAVKSAVVAGTMNVIINPSGIPFSKVTLLAGTKIALPDCIRLSACGNSNFVVAANGYTLVAVSDVAIPLDGSGISIPVTMAGLDFGTNGLAPVNDTFPMTGKIEILDGKVHLDPMDFTGETLSILSGRAIVVKNDTPLSELGINYSYQIAISNVTSVTLKVNNQAAPEFTETYGFDVEGLPEMLTQADVQIEFAELQVDLGVESGLPTDFDLSAKIQTIKDNQPVKTFPIGPLTFKSKQNTLYSLGEHADGIEGGVIYKKVAGLGGILNPVPARIEATDFVMSMGNDWITVNTGETFGAKLQVGLSAPLSFTANTRLSLGVDVEMNLDLGSTGKSIKPLNCVLDCNISNTVPLGFSLSATALDADKKPMEGITSVVTGSVQPGKIGDPSSNDISIALQIDPSKVIKGIRLDLAASSNESVAGTRLNQEQGLTLSKLSITLPEGITADIKDITTNKENKE